jgi:hypothetical protein
MSFNLQRDAKVYVSTVQTGFDQTNTFEVRVMAGFSFNQTTETADVSVDEAGATPSRGSKRFNVKLNPSDIKFSTYIRPYQEAGVHNCPERILWEGLVGNDTLGTNAVSDGTGVHIDLDGSNVHELKKLYMFVDYGNVKYRIDEAVIGAARIGFDIQSIAMIEWTGNGKEMKEVTSPTTASTFPTTGNFKAVPNCADFIKNKLSTITLSGDYNKTAGSQVINFGGSTTFADGTLLGLANGAYTFTVACNGDTPVTYTFNALLASTTVGDFIDFLANSLCCASIGVNFTAKTITLTSEKFGTGSTIAIVDGTLFAAINALAAFNCVIDSATAGTTASRSYNIPITGGEININNNVTFLTPDELGVVNKPIGHFTGTRSTTGNLTAYLRSGANNDASGLIRDLYNSVDDVTASFACVLDIGGTGNTPRVTINMPTAHISIPTIDTQDVISTSIDFMAVPTDLGATDELTINYVASVPSAALLVSP